MAETFETTPEFSLPSRKLDVVMACRWRDHRILRLALPWVQRLLPCRKVVLYVPDAEAGRFRKAFGRDAEIREEDAALPGLTLAEFRRFPVQSFPRGAGWYYQQFLKYAHAFTEPESEYYLIWDADTIPLRPMEFFDAEGRMVFTTSGEHHVPYFETYRRLLGEDAWVEFSFISQHQVVCKALLREMLGKIEGRHGKPWPKAIADCLQPQGYNLFSEYETYGHYLKNHHAARMVFRTLPWLREGVAACGYPPRKACLEKLARDYAFAAFETRDRWSRRWINRILSWLRQI